MDDKLDKLKEILKISTENVSANHWIPAIHEDKHEALAEEIVKLFAIPVVSFNEERVAVCYNRGCVDQLNGNCHHTLTKYKRCKSKQTES